MQVNFHSCFDAEKAAKRLGWIRHHNYGSLKFDVDVDDINKLKGIGYWVENRTRD